MELLKVNYTLRLLFCKLLWSFICVEIMPKTNLRSVGTLSAKFKIDIFYSNPTDCAWLIHCDLYTDSAP